MLASPSVSLPSIHEMFPDHLIRSDDPQQRPRSHRGSTYPQPPGVHHQHRAEGAHCACSHQDCPRSSEDIRGVPTSSARRRSSASTASSSSHSHSHPQNIYAFNVLRSSPSVASLQHITSASPSGSSSSTATGVGAEYYDNYGQDGRSAYPSPSDAYTQQRTRGSAEGRDPNASFPVSRSSGGPLPLPTSSSSLSTQHRQQYRSPPSHGDLEEDDDGNASGAEDNDTSNGKKHVCATCFKRFNRPSSLRIHVNTHTGATPFRCPWPNCGREFNVNSNMRRHYRNHTTPGFSRSSSSSQQTPSSTANGNPPPNVSTTGAITNTNNQSDGRRKRRRVSVPIPAPTQISSTDASASANRGFAPDSGYPHTHPHPHPVYRGEYTYTYRHPHPTDPHYQQSTGIPPNSEFSPPSPFSSSQNHHPHAYTHNLNGYGHGHTQYANNNGTHSSNNNGAHSRPYTHPQIQRYNLDPNAESVMSSPPISNLSMSEEEEDESSQSGSGSGDESDGGIGRERGMFGRGGRENREKNKVDDEGDEEEGEEEYMQYDERGYRTRVAVHERTHVHAHAHHPYSHTRSSYSHPHRVQDHREGGASGKQRPLTPGKHTQRPLTPGSSFHSSSPSPSVSPSPPPPRLDLERHALERHVVSAERGRGSRGAAKGQEQEREREQDERKTTSSGYKYSASTPYVRSLADSRVSTTLRPAFSRVGSVSSGSASGERD